jgi:hypothetical protein
MALEFQRDKNSRINSSEKDVGNWKYQIKKC